MKNQVLYRKYRPQKFSEMIGQEHIIKTIINEISSENIAHAFLFTGPRGSGKTTTGRLLAKALNCQNRKEGKFEPCGKCESCQEIVNQNAIDLIEIDAASNRGIDDIRELKEGIGFSPVKSKYKVFILDEAHQLSKDANNALLKTLEEPPEHAIFILATTESRKMLPTIVSRCQRFDFRRLSAEEIENYLKTILKKEGVDFEEEAVSAIAEAADGGLRDALSMLDQVLSFTEKNIKKEKVFEILGLAEEKISLDIIENIANKKVKEAIEILNQSVFKGSSPEEAARSITKQLRDIMLYKVSGKFYGNYLKNSPKEEGRVKKIIKTLGEKIPQITERFEKAEKEIPFASIPQLPVEIAIVEISSQKE